MSGGVWSDSLVAHHTGDPHAPPAHTPRTSTHSVSVVLQALLGLSFPVCRVSDLLSVVCLSCLLSVLFLFLPCFCLLSVHLVFVFPPSVRPHVCLCLCMPTGGCPCLSVSVCVCLRLSVFLPRVRLW